MKCHGVVGTTAAAYAANNNTAAPGYWNTGVNTAGTVGTLTNNVSSDSKVGAHNKHLNASTVWGTVGYSNDVSCSNCRTVYATPQTAGHMDGVTTFVWSSLARNSGTDWTSVSGVLTPTYTGGACSAVYCHGAGFWPTNRGTGLTVGWTSSAYLTASPWNTSTMSVVCNQCHMSPPRVKHDGVTAHPAASLSPANCNTCHGHNGWGSNHINGKLEAAGGACNGCHWYDTSDAGAWLTSEPSPSSNLWNSTNAWGALVKHINHLKARWGSVLTASTDTYGGTAFTNVCGICHTQSSANHTVAAGRMIFTGSTADQFGSAATSWNTITRSCSSVACHFKPTPQW